MESISFSLKCWGTHSVELQRDDFDLKVSGMVAAFLPSSTESLDVMVTDGTSTYRGSIPTKDVKGNWHDDEGSISLPESLASCLLGEGNADGKKQSMNASYTLLSAENAVKLVLKETVTSGLVRVLWSGVFKKTPSNTMPFILGKGLNQAHEENQQLKTKIGNLISDLKMCKDTVTKLDTALQSEKDELLQRFLTLYNISKANLRKANEKVEQLERKLKNYKGTKATTGEGRSRAVLPVFGASEDDAPEPAALEPFDADLVERLAAGSNSSGTTSTRRTARSLAKEEPLTRASTACGTIRRNPLNGAIEMWDAKGIFADDGDDADSPTADEKPDNLTKKPNKAAEKPNKKRQGAVNVDEYSSSDSIDFLQAKKQRKEPPKVSKTVDSGSETEKEDNGNDKTPAKKPSAKPTEDDYSSSDSIDFKMLMR